MSTMEFKRRRIASAVFKEAWNYNKRTSLYQLTFASSLKLAWRIVRAVVKLNHTKIRGVVHAGRQLLLQRLSRCTQKQVVLSFKRDSNNVYDDYAVQIIATSIKTGAEAVLGYASSMIAPTIANALDCGRRAIILDWCVTGQDKQFRGCNITYVIQ